MVKICKPAPRKLFGLILFALIIVVADRLVKDLVLANIDLHEKIDLIPGVFRLTYTQNTGGAFSAFSGENHCTPEFSSSHIFSASVSSASMR